MGKEERIASTTRVKAGVSVEKGVPLGKLGIL